MKKPRKISPKKTRHFVQSVHPYGKEIFVCTGFKSADQIIAVQKKYKAEKFWMEWCQDRKEIWDQMIKEGCAFVSMNKRGCAVIFLRDFEDTWEFWEVLIHELHHYVYFLSEQISATDETELQAYLQEWLFRQIRRRLKNLK